MKKKIIIPIIVCLIIIIGIAGFITWNNRTVSTITLDINPSMEIRLTKNEKIKNIKALNDEAKEVIDNNLKGKSLDDALDTISKQIIEKGYVEDGYVVILLYSTGNIKNKEVELKIRDCFGEKEVDTNIIVIDSFTKDDESLAKKYKISPSKAAYINSIRKENENISINNLVNKSVNDLNETKATGNYCDEGYILEGDWCLKEKERVTATNGEVCPRGYYDYNGNCYEEVPIENTDKLYCRDEFKLDGNKCVRTQSINAEPVKYICPFGEESTNYKAGITDKNAKDANDIVCIDTSEAKHPVSPCETHDGTEYTLSGGKCYWHRAPVIDAGCPGKVLVNGMCWDDASNILICEGYRDGKQYSSRSEYCEHSIKYIEPIVSEYKCPRDYTLNDKICLKDETDDAQYEKVCPSGYTLVNNDRCINQNKAKAKESGLVCEGENTRLRGNTCVVYEMVEAKHN